MTLRDLVIKQQITGEKDSELVTEWILSNGDVTEYIKILSELATKKINYDKFVYGTLVSDMQLYGATRNLIDTYGLENGLYFDNICRKYVICNRLGKDFEKEYPQFIEWLKEFVPNNKQPFVFWYDFLVYLNSKGIYFKNQKNMEKENDKSREDRKFC